MSDRLYLEHLNIGRSGEEDRELGASPNAFLSLAVHGDESWVTLTKNEACELRDALIEWLSR